MGRNAVATVSLAFGALLGIAALAMMLAAVRSRAPHRFVNAAIAATLGTLIAMLLSRDQVRRGMLALAGFEPSTWIVPQWA